MDQTLHCMICRTAFIHTEREQQFLEGLFREGKIDEIAAPKRCKPCRERKPRLPMHTPGIVATPVPVQFAPADTARPDNRFYRQAPVALKEEIQDPEERRDPAVQLKEVISHADAKAIEAASRLPIHEELHFVLVGGDFERLVCRQEVQLRGPKGQVITLKLAAIGLQAMKEAMEKGVMAWWRS